MLGLIGLFITAAAAGLGYAQARSFVAGRLRFVDAVQSPLAPFVAGAAATVVAAPVAWVLPLVGTGSAILFGAAVGIGTRSGARAIRQRARTAGL